MMRPRLMPFRRLAPVVLALAVAPLAPAQIAHTAPAGFLNTTTGGSTGQPFSAQVSTRTQVCHPSLIGTPIPGIIALNWRRDITSFRGTNVARTVVLDMAMGHGDIGAFDEVFAANFTVNRAQVVTGRSVNLPDTLFLQGNQVNPEPWSSRVPLDQPFSYDGVNALVLELAVRSTTSPNNGYYVDAGTFGAGGQMLNLRYGSTNDTGCTATGRSGPMFLSTTAYSHVQGRMMRVGASIARAPASMPVVLYVAATDANLTIPGLCARLHALPQIELPLGGADAAGAIAEQFFRFGYVPSLLTSSLAVQAVALDAGQAGLPVVVSNDQTLRWPTAPTTAPGQAYTQAADLVSPHGTPVAIGGVPIVGLER